MAGVVFEFDGGTAHVFIVECDLDGPAAPADNDLAPGFEDARNGVAR